jgi:hypothetical protein
VSFDLEGRGKLVNVDDANDVEREGMLEKSNTMTMMMPSSW